MTKKMQKVKAIKGFWDKEAKKWRATGDEWEVTPERCSVLKGNNIYKLKYVEVVNADSSEKNIRTNTIRKESEKE